MIKNAPITISIIPVAFSIDSFFLVRPFVALIPKIANVDNRINGIARPTP